MQKCNQTDRHYLVLSEQTFPIIEQITAGMPGGFFIYHADGDEQLIYANRALFRIFGCESLEEFQALTGYTFPGLVHSEDIERVERSIKRQIDTCGNNPDYVEYRIVRKDGAIRWIEDYGHFAHTDLYGDLFYVFVEDATEKHPKAIDDARTAQLAQERLEALDSPEPQQLTACRILLAEDNILNQEIVVTILEDAGCTVDVAADGAEAVEKVRRCVDTPYDLILMDIQMPVMNGIETTKAIRAMDDPKLARLPIVAMTAGAFEEDRQRVLSAGMDGHLGKPVDTGKLLATLQSILGRAAV